MVVETGLSRGVRKCGRSAGNAEYGQRDRQVPGTEGVEADDGILKEMVPDGRASWQSLSQRPMNDRVGGGLVTPPSIAKFR